MNAHTALLEQWRKVLVFNIGADDTWSFNQLPDVQRLPLRFPIDPVHSSKYGYREDYFFALNSLGHVLTIAAIRLIRDPAKENVGSIDLCPIGGWFPDTLEAARTLDKHYHTDIFSECCSSAFGIVVEMALCAPGRLPVLCSRLDALDNAALHKLAMDAVQGAVIPWLFEDLLELPAVAK
jgi:hypothetical protein